MIDTPGDGLRLDQRRLGGVRDEFVAAALPADAAALVDVLRGLEELKAGIAAVQARAAVAFAELEVERQRAAGVGAEERGRGVAAQVALARRESPHVGSRLLGTARALVHEMPFTLHALELGALSEYRSMLLVRETACLSVEHRREVDAALCANPARVASLGSRHLVAEARRIGYRLDPESVVRRAARAETERCVSLRPAPDAMTYLTALLPLAQGVACYAALSQAADQARATGEPRGRGQVMADTLVERLTGQESAGAVPLGVHLVMTDATLLAGDNEPGHVQGAGPIPAGVARRLVALAPETRSWVKRLYRAPRSDQLVALESTARCFPKGLAALVALRDQTCRTPWCDAPIRHIDHVTPHGEGGPTSFRNAQGLCEACNHAKQAPGWRARARHGSPGVPHEVILTTPTGHRYAARAPGPPGTPRRGYLADLVFAA